MSSNQGKKNMKSDPVNINVDNVELMSTLNQDSCVVLSIPQDINHVFPYSLETAKKDNNTKYILYAHVDNSIIEDELDNNTPLPNR